MAHLIQFATRATRRSSWAAVLVIPVLLAASAPVQGQYATPPIDQGLRYFMATHSFNVFIGPNSRTDDPGPLAKLAAEAELQGHTNLGIQMIGGSTPMQHWNQGDGDDNQNLAKVGLRGGGVDVFTMSPNAIMPEEGIDLFGDLMIETNPQGRILVQNSWSAWDGNGTTASVGGTSRPDFSNEDHDRADIATIQGWIDGIHAPGGYLERMRTQLAGINERAGRDMAYVVPSADAVYRLRQEVLRGRIPGIERQSELFRDGMGHPNTPIVNLVSYVWFTVMYRQPAAGLTALIDPNDPTSPERERLLQQIAWDVSAAEPMSGITNPVLWPSGRNMHDLLHRLGTDPGAPGAEHQDHQ
ncbi:MAG: hypothetical protein OEO79_01375 [Gemmatimonadota bacterium]|nr:hypothetical protein [Gemmatimonadota bacterium]